MKKKLNYKHEPIKSLIDIQTAILDTIGQYKVNKEKEHLQVETRPILQLQHCTRKTNQYMLTNETQKGALKTSM